MRQIEGFRGGLNTDVTGRKRDKGMTALYESRISLKGRFASSGSDQAANL
jgi:hypothetical protein